MNRTALQILRALERDAELPLGKIASSLPKRYGDHRDFYVIASLLTGGYIVDHTLHDGANTQSAQDVHEQAVAQKLYAYSIAEGASVKYRNTSYSIHGSGEQLSNMPLALTAKGSLHLSEIRTKRFDRLFGLGSGILVGVLVALVASYLRTTSPL